MAIVVRVVSVGGRRVRLRNGGDGLEKIVVCGGMKVMFAMVARVAMKTDGFWYTERIYREEGGGRGGVVN